MNPFNINWPDIVGVPGPWFSMVRHFPRARTHHPRQTRRPRRPGSVRVMVRRRAKR